MIERNEIDAVKQCYVEKLCSIYHVHTARGYESNVVEDIDVLTIATMHFANSKQNFASMVVTLN